MTASKSTNDSRSAILLRILLFSLIASLLPLIVGPKRDDRPHESPAAAHR